MADKKPNTPENNAAMPSRRNTYIAIIVFVSLYFDLASLH